MMFSVVSNNKKRQQQWIVGFLLVSLCSQILLNNNNNNHHQNNQNTNVFTIVQGESLPSTTNIATTTTTTNNIATVPPENQKTGGKGKKKSLSTIISTKTRTQTLEGHGIVREQVQEEHKGVVQEEEEQEEEQEEEEKKKRNMRRRSLRSKKSKKTKKNVVTPVKMVSEEEAGDNQEEEKDTTTASTSTSKTIADEDEDEDDEVNADFYKGGGDSSSSSKEEPSSSSSSSYDISKPIVSRNEKYNEYYKEYCTQQRMEMYLPNHEQSCEEAGQRAKPYIRTGDFEELHPEEAEWVNKRNAVTAPKIRNFIQSKIGVDIGSNGKSSNLKIANVYSGGGKRAMLTSSGVAHGLHDMGVLDHSTWMAGLSGGSWFISNLLSEMYTNDSKTYPEEITEVIQPNLNNITMAFFNDYYELKNTFSSGIEDMLQGKGKYTAEIDCYVAARNNYKDYDGITDDQRKLHAPDVWGQITGYTFLSSMDTGGLGVSFSDLREYNALANHEIALPVFTITQLRDMDFDLATEKDLEKHDMSVTPFDMSFYDDSGSGSFPTAIFGSSFNNGEEEHADEHGEDTCQTRMDQWSMIMGLSSWAIGMASVDPDLTPFGPMASTVVDSICNEGECKPFTLHNPYYNFSDVGLVAESETVDLLDGAGVSNLPLYSFVNKGREADIVIAFDSSGENTGGAKYSSSPPGKSSGSCAAFTTEYPDGGAIRDTQAFIEKYGITETSMPTMPTKRSEWRSGNDYYLRKNTFFGCDEVEDKTAVVYIPNRPIESCKNGIFIAEGIFDMHFNFGIFDIPLTNDWKADSAKRTMVESIQNVKSENFDICLACLYAAKAAESTDIWEDNETCKQCYSDYCFTSDELKRQMEITKEEESNNDDIEDFVGDFASGFGF